MPGIHDSGSHWAQLRLEEEARQLRKRERRDAEFARARASKGW